MRAGVERALESLRFLPTQTPATLSALAVSRGVVPESSWDTYELAQALSSPDALWHQVSGLDRETLIRLHEAVESNTPSTAFRIENPSLLSRTPGGEWMMSPTLHDALETHSTTWQEVVEGLLSDTPPSHQASVHPPKGQVDKAIPGIIDTLGQLRWVLETVGGHEVLSRQPGHEALAKALSPKMPPGQDDLSRATRWAVTGNLCHHLEGSWWLTPTGEELLTADDPTILAALVSPWWADGPAHAKRMLQEGPHPSREDLVALVEWHYPLTNTDALRHWLELGEQWGVFVGGHPTALLTGLTAGEISATTLRKFFPPYSDTVYPDGVDGLVAPGPLSQNTRGQLLKVAIEERRGMTPRFVIDRHTVLNHLQQEGSDGLLGSLEPLIVGGVPGELRRQIVDLENRAGSLTLESDGRQTRVGCIDQELADLLAVDQKLSRLDLTRETGQRLTSPWPVETVRQIFQEAGYPTFPPHHTPLRRVRDLPSSIPVDRSWWEERIADATPDQGYQPWWETLIRDAIRSRTPLALCVDTGSQHQWMVVDPLSLAGGRLRVIDEASEVERTLPLKLIVAFDIAEPGGVGNT